MPIKKREKQINFQLFRYQILPISKSFQQSFEPKISSREELIEKKNYFFEKSLLEVKEFDYSRTKLVHEKEDLGEGKFIIRIGAKKKIVRSTKSLTDEELENWPRILVLIDNSPNKQIIAIQEDRKAFADTITVSKIISSTINPKLHSFQLSLHVEKMFEKKIFWNIIEQYKNKILQAEFELISPNLANISKNLNFDLKGIAGSTNTQKTKIQLNSDKDSSLELSQSDHFINGIVNYAADGGGETTIRVRGIKKKINTSKGTRESSINEVEFSTSDKSALRLILDKIFRG